MSGSGDPLLELATAVAEGRRVDWEEAAARHPHLVDRLANLRRLEGLSDRFARELAEAPEPAEAAAVGSWGHLQLSERIGEGSFGEVWRAFDPVLQRDVALKLVRREAEATGGGPSFIHEARRLARLRHPHIVGVHGADVHDGRVGLWAELLEGRTLEEEMAGGLGGPARRLEIARQLASALAAVHRAGLVHGDVKASNVVVERDGRVVLTDFGAGTDLAAPGGGEGSWGSPLTAAPERFEETELAPPADVWSLGVLFHRLFGNGSYPFEAEDLDGLRRLHRRRSGTTGPAVPPTGASRRSPRDLERLVQRMLAPGAEDRPSAAEVEARLAWIEQGPRRRRRRFAVAAVIASLVLGLLATGAGYLHARGAAERAELARRDAEEVSRFLEEVLGAPQTSAGGRQVLVVDVLDSAARRVEATLEPGSPARARIWQLIGRTNLSLERSAEAEQQLRRAVRELDVAYSPHHPTAIHARLQLSQALCEQERPDLAACDALVDEAAELAESLPADHAAHGWVLIHRSASAERRGDLAEAERLLLRGRARRAPAEPGQDSLRDLLEIHLARIRTSRGEYGKVADTLADLAPRFEAAYGIRHGHTTAALNLLGVSLSALGRRHEALEILRHLADETTDWLGSEDVYTLQAQANVAAILKELDHVAEAAALEEELHARAARSFGADHPSTLQLASNLALSWKLLGRVDDAERLMEELEERAATALGRHHPLRHILAVNRSELRIESGRPGEAVDLATAARDVMLERLPGDHLFVLAVESVLGAALCEMGRCSEGLGLLRAALEAQRRLAGPEDLQALLTQVRLGEALEGVGEREEARRVLEEAEELARGALGESHRQTIAARTALERLGDGP